MKDEMNQQEIKSRQQMMMFENSIKEFDCQRCGKCCVEEPGIALSIHDIKRIATALVKPVKVIKREYTVHDPKRRGDYFMKDVLPCHFYDLEQKKCSIYKYRPTVCRTFPFKMSVREDVIGIEVFPQCTNSEAFTDRMNIKVQKMLELNKLIKEELERVTLINPMLGENIKNEMLKKFTETSTKSFDQYNKRVLDK